MLKPDKIPISTICRAIIAVAWTAVFSGQLLCAQDETADRKKAGALVRMICVESVSKEEETLSLAAKSGNGEWNLIDTIDVRASFITDWVRLPHGAIHLLRQDGGEKKSLASFTLQPQMQRAIIILFPSQTKDAYIPQLIDPLKLEFSRGKTLILNYSGINALVSLGGNENQVKPGQHIVTEARKNDDNMYRALVAYRDEENKLVVCYDRFVSEDPRTRKLLMILPDAQISLRVLTLSEFGPFE